MTTRFTREDVGCYVDGSFGDAHLRSVLADLLPSVQSIDGDLRSTAPIASDLLSDDPDVYDAAVWEAIDILQEQTEAGCNWVLEGGDLLLTDESEE